MTVTPVGARLTGPEAQLLLFLATYHSEIDGAARWPTIEEQRAFMRLQERRVQWLNAKLEEKGCIRRDHRGGRGRSTTYELLMQQKGAVSDKAEEKGRTPDDTLYMEDNEKGALQTTPFIQPEEQKGAVKGAVSDTERVQSAVPDGGTIGGSTSPSFPSVTTEIRETTEKETGAVALAAPSPSVQGLLSVLTGQPGFEPSPQFVAKLATKYGHLDLEEEAIKMVGWLKTPKAKRDKRTCTTAFVLNWLRGELEPLPPRNGRQRQPEPDDDGPLGVHTLSPENLEETLAWIRGEGPKPRAGPRPP